MKKRFFLIFSLLAQTGAAALYASDTGTFVSAEAEDVYTLDPAAIYDRQSFCVYLNIFEPLVIYSTDSAKPFLPFLSAEVPTAENGLLSKDGMTYSFPIRKGVKFHDGSELSPDDVRYSLLRFLLQDRDGGPAAMLLKPIMGVYSTRNEKGEISVSYKDAAAAVLVEGDKLVVKLKEPYTPFLDIMAAWPFVTSKKWAAAHGDWDGEEATWEKYNNLPAEKSPLRFNPDGTGPFRLESVDQEKHSVVLSRNDSYWRGPAALDKLVFNSGDGELTRLAMLQTGDADFARLTRSSLRDAAGAPGIEVIDDLPSFAEGNIIFFTFKIDTKDNAALGSGKLDGRGIPPDFFSDPDVRKGFAYAFNYAQYFDDAMRGKGMRAPGPFLIPGDKPAYDFNPDKAASHFKKAWAGALWEKGFETEIAFLKGDGEACAAAEILSNGLKKINPLFALRLKPMDKAGQTMALLKHRLPVFIGGFEPDYPDMHSYAFNLIHSAGYYPKAQVYSNAKTDALVDEAMKNPDEAVRERTYRKIQDLHKTDLPQLYLYSPVFFKCVRTGVRGAKTDRLYDPFTLHNAFYFYRVKKSG